jgi:DNA polymerase III subunit delta'
VPTAATDRSPLTKPPPPWLGPHWASLQRARASGRLPHALLIDGPAGVGKRQLANLLVRSLLCTDPSPDGLPCGQCADCRLNQAGNHPDLVRLGPDPDSKSDEIKVAGIRDLIESEGLTPSRGVHKLILIDPADRLNPSAANALLKTLEEPASGTLFCLISERSDALTATVRSRCQSLTLGLPDEALAQDWLAGQLSGGDARLLLRLAHGAPLRALSLADPALLARREAAFSGFVAVGQGRRDPVAEAQAWSDLGPRVALEWLGGWVGDLLRLTVNRAAYLGNPDKREPLADLAERLNPEDGHRYLQRILRRRASQDTPLNPQLLHEALLIDWAQVVRKVS